MHSSVGRLSSEALGSQLREPGLESLAWRVPVLSTGLAQNKNSLIIGWSIDTDLLRVFRAKPHLAKEIKT